MVFAHYGVVRTLKLITPSATCKISNVNVWLTSTQKVLGISSEIQFCPVLADEGSTPDTTAAAPAHVSDSKLAHHFSLPCSAFGHNFSIMFFQA